MERIKSWLLLLLTGALLVSLTYIKFRRVQPEPKTPPAMPHTISGSSISAPIQRTYLDSSGSRHVVIDANANEQIRRGAVEVAAPIAATIDSLKRVVDAKQKQIEGYTAVMFTAGRDSVRFLQRIDSLKRLTYFYKDKYLRLTVRTAQEEGDTTLGNNSFDFAYDADLKFVDYWKRRKVLGLPIGVKEHFTDISSSDSRMQILGVDRFTVQHKVPALGFRVQAVAAYNFLTESYGAGAGVRFDVGDFNAGLNYIYNTQEQRWVPTLLARYDLLQFGR